MEKQNKAEERNALFIDSQEEQTIEARFKTSDIEREQIKAVLERARQKKQLKAKGLYTH
jgi:hypothetical protein